MQKEATYIKNIEPGTGEWNPVESFNDITDNGSLWNARLPEEVNNMLRFYVKGALYKGHIYISNESPSKRRVYLCSKRGRVINYFDVKTSELKDYLKKII